MQKLLFDEILLFLVFGQVDHRVYKIIMVQNVLTFLQFYLEMK